MKLLKSKHIDPLLIGICLLAAFLNIYGIWKDQYANAYYTAAVTSMLQSLHNFFFASFDPGGFVTVDKPPVAFWIQTMFASVFGVHGWSVILPQALAGVGSVLLIYALIKPSFGKTAARFSALVAACTPIAVAASRSNNVDSLLVFTLLSVTWMLFKAIKTKKWSWSIAAFSTIGVGFNIKMLQAYMVLPAFYLFYLIAFKVNWKKKMGVLAASTVALLIVSLSWPLIVDSIPKENRPYVGSSQTNSVLELAFGYNGISRLTGQGGPGGGNRAGDGGGIPASQEMSGQRQDDGGQMPTGLQGQPLTGQSSDGGGLSQNSAGQNPAIDDNNSNRQMRDGGPGGGAPGDGGNGGNGMFNTGTAGPLRLFQPQLSGQISWLLPFALLAAVGLLLGIRPKKPLTDKQKESLFWLAWLIPMMGFFSVAGFFHQYYLIMLAPPIAALTGAGWVELFNFNRNREGWKRWLLPVGFLGTTAFEIYILLPYKTQIGLGLPIAVGVVGIVVSLILCLPLSTRTLGRELKISISRVAALGGILILLVAPLYWATTPLIYGDNAMMPAAGPQNGAGMHGQGPGQDQAQAQSKVQVQDQTQNLTQDQTHVQAPNQSQGQPQENVDTQLLAYLTANNTGEKYLFATTNAGTAEAYIINTGKAVMAMGGFSGSDPILTVDKLKQMVANKEVKYFLSSSGGPGGGSSDVQAWIIQNGKVVPQTEWQSSTNNGNFQGGKGMNGSQTLYEIKF
ncbi:glycosyltransferase family 39 protein [Desulfosporosinus sp. Sb-LF]|uniref:glycosyltransferase family 39 protein n=1 Tax=Desulfosporosinus sp. Sb-LF TaxID=2560027 RepID=UPI00107F335D|nr:glycosyltransferase family 39 protein [Desulfosporosinus sp. Sb-LF]TGE32082.1 glycosyltransferase family 39 protein [Desulfosporosinus sp. Sb-LF]